METSKRRRKQAVSTDRLPPNALEAEQGVIGTIINFPNCYQTAADVLRCGSEAFYDMRNRAIYETQCELHVESLPIDMVTLVQRLRDKQLLEQIGGIPYLSAIQDVGHSAGNLSFWLDILIEKYVLRKIIQTAGEITGAAFEHTGEIREFVDQVERDFLKIGQSLDKAHTGATIKQLVHKAIEGIERQFERKGAISGIPTGYPDLDKQTDGLHGGDMVVLVAYPSVGKTSLAMNIAENVVLDSKIPVGVFSLEMSSTQLVTRFMCSNARVNLKNVRDGLMSENDFPKLTSSAGKISACSIYIDDTADLSIYELRSRARRMSQQYGIKLFVIDYLQLLNGFGGRKHENRSQELADISTSIKKMAKELDAAVIVLSQLNDDGKILGSRQPGMDGDGVWELQRNGPGTPEVDLIALHVKKNRNGPRDVFVHFTFLKQFTRFESASKIDPNDFPPQE